MGGKKKELWVRREKKNLLGLSGKHDVASRWPAIRAKKEKYQRRVANVSSFR